VEIRNTKRSTKLTVFKYKILLCTLIISLACFLVALSRLFEAQNSHATVMWTHWTKHKKFHLKQTCLQFFYALFSVRVEIAIQGNDATFTEVRLYLSAVRTDVSLSDSRPVYQDSFLSNSCLRSIITGIVFTCDSVLFCVNNMDKSNHLSTIICIRQE